jgi:hypothetical protein
MLDDVHESAENAPIRMVRQSSPGGNVDKSLNQNDSHREIRGPVSRTMPVNVLNR